MKEKEDNFKRPPHKNAIYKKLEKEKYYEIKRESTETLKEKLIR